MKLPLFLKSWLQRDPFGLDIAGCPHWLIRRRCGIIAWGNILRRGSSYLDTFGISAERVQAVIDQMRKLAMREAASRLKEAQE